MNPIQFREANCTFHAPPEMTADQCQPIPAYRGVVPPGSSVSGTMIVVVAYQPTEQEILAIAAGRPIFLTMCGGLAPHFLSLSFDAATHPQ